MSRGARIPFGRPGSLLTRNFREQYLFTANSFCPRLTITTISAGERGASVEAGDNESGHIQTKQNEGIFFFDHVFPLKLQWMYRIPYLNLDKFLAESLQKIDKPNSTLANPFRTIKQSFPEDISIKVTQVLPRVREGGAFIKFSHKEGMLSTELENIVKVYLKQNPITPWFNPFRRVRAFLVEGRPWIEDLNRLPSSRLKVEFLPSSPKSSAVELSQETLYTIFRKYGKLSEISEQPSESKITPRYALIHYTRIQYATMAKNCMHGFVVPVEAGGKAGTLLKLSYEPKVKAHWLREWLIGHSRIIIPLVVGLLTAAWMAVIDPIRAFFIKIHITQSLQLEDQPIYRWIKRQLSQGYHIIGSRNQRADSDNLRTIWEDRQDAITQLQAWIETADTFLVVQGPRGAGKKELINQVLKERPHKLVIDCKRIQEARGDSKKIAAAAAEVGYRPVFSWMNSISSLIDLTAIGIIGTKTGFSETLDTQLAKIRNNTMVALKQIALAPRKEDRQGAQLPDDVWLEVHPEHRPVVVIDNFLHKNYEVAESMVYEKLAEWAAVLTTQNIAHVIFLTTDISFSKSLSKALPDRVFRQITLSDCTLEVAKKFVIQHLDTDHEEGTTALNDQKTTASHLRTDLDELDDVIQVLGGRLTDLKLLARRIKTGESPKKAVRQIIEHSALEILKMHLLDVDVSSRKWTPQHAWLLIKELAANETLRYNELLLNDLFKDGEVVLQALEQAELITITSKMGRPYGVKPGKPVYKSAFEYLTRDEVLTARLDLAVLVHLIRIENTKVDRYETELKMLAELPIMPNELKPRVRWCLNKAMASHAKIEKYEAQIGRLKKVLTEKF